MLHDTFKVFVCHISLPLLLCGSPANSLLQLLFVLAFSGFWYLIFCRLKLDIGQWANFVTASEQKPIKAIFTIFLHQNLRHLTLFWILDYKKSDVHKTWLCFKSKLHVVYKLQSNLLKYKHIDLPSWIINSSFLEHFTCNWNSRVHLWVKINNQYRVKQILHNFNLHVIFNSKNKTNAGKETYRIRDDANDSLGAKPEFK